MKVTMLYFDTISKLIKKYGYSWDDVNSIQDHDGRVYYAYSEGYGSGGYTESLEYAFYIRHMHEFDENGEREQVLIKAFLEALEEARAGSRAVAV